ncbi:MAG TPA: hypothetical protein PLL72_03170 [Burkholderiaceae bacterium]|nr:hypothetical protein [Burkholderiaceae bacterium]
MKMARYLQSYFDVDGSGNSRPKYEAGQDYPVTEETTRHVALRYAEEVDVPDPAPVADPALAAEAPPAAAEPAPAPAPKKAAKA